MNFDKTVLIPTTTDAAWDFLMDVPAVGGCIPGVEELVALDDDHFTGVMRVKVGSIRVRFEGTITVVERDREALRARLEAQGNDKRVGGAVRAQVAMTLAQSTADEVEMRVQTEAAVMGRLGELGQAVMLRKADQVMVQFAGNMAARLSPESAPADSAAGREPPAPAAPPASAAPATPPASPPPPARRPGPWRRFVAWLRRRRSQ